MTEKPEETTQEVETETQKYDVEFREKPPRFVLTMWGVDISSHPIHYNSEHEAYYMIVADQPVLLAYSSHIEAQDEAEGLVWKKDRLIKIILEA